MRAVIMCGGRGSRLNPLTETTPKPLLKLMNRPVLDIIIEKLIDEGVSDIYLSLGYKSLEIINFCESQNYDAEIRYCEEKKMLGTAGGVRNCINNTEEDIIVLSGDNIFDFDLGPAVDFHRQNGAAFTIVGTTVEDPREYGVIIKDEKDNIISFDEKPAWENVRSNIINTGIYIINGKLLELIPTDMFYDFAKDLFPVLFNKKYKFMCYKTEGFWGDMGEFNEYKKITEYLFDNSTIFKYKGTMIREDMTDKNGCKYIAPCLIGNNITTSDGASVGPYCVIDDDCKIGRNCIIKKSIIGCSCEINENTEINDSIFDSYVTVKDNCVAEKDVVIGYNTVINRFTRIEEGSIIRTGCIIPKEAVINKNIYSSKHAGTVFDGFEMTGKLYNEISLNDVLKTGKAIGALKTVGKVGIGTDGNEFSELYKDAVICGLRSAGVNCYDFSSIFAAQIIFYSFSCNLDIFVYISIYEDNVILRFYGKNGSNLSNDTIREINLLYKNCGYTEIKGCGNHFDMALCSSVYRSQLRKKYKFFADKINFTCECENLYIKEMLDSLIKRNPNPKLSSVRFIIGKNGKDLYAIEKGNVYSSVCIKDFLYEYFLAKGKTLIIPEDASVSAETISKKYNGKIIRFSSCTENEEINDFEIAECLWCFDAVFLAFEICMVMAEADICLGELLENTNESILQRKVFSIDQSPGMLHEELNRIFGKKSDIYYEYLKSDSKGTIRVRQLGNTSKIRVIAEASKLETANEITSELINKIQGTLLDN